MTYNEFRECPSFGLEELLAFSQGLLIEDPPRDFEAKLPAPPFLMMDRVLSMTVEGRQGTIVAEQDIHIDAWYFQCHFRGDPVQPGCLCVDAIWQLLGFYGLWRGGLGSGRALGCGEVAFNGQIRPFNKVVRYEIAVKRFAQLKESGASIIIGDGEVFVDDESITQISLARTGIFKGITYPDYPKRSRNSVGGMIKERL
ncbi:MAG: bifunctional 3-hydroxydecanoyl-ACP dehydratase/trans-2-decenoyl-ACP isomerase [Deltaproteobacteria bacterium]|nr:bifunctional 3-hydroxydecanoyl-ACP dehydratase/trans-2-decenoyl-ACP isomerase [Deltaproteobacteria bacterium]